MSSKLAKRILGFFDAALQLTVSVATQIADLIRAEKRGKWKSEEQKERFEKMKALIIPSLVLGSNENLRRFRAVLEDHEKQRRIEEMIRKADNSVQVSSYSEGRSIADQLHEHIDVATDAHLALMFYYSILSGTDESSGEKQLVDPQGGTRERSKSMTAFFKQVHMIERYVDIESKLEKLGWSAREQWPSYERLDSLDFARIKREVQVEAKSIEGRFGPDALSTLQAYMENADQRLAEVEAVIEEYDPEKQGKSRLTEQPLGERLFVGRLVKFKDVLLCKLSLYQRFFQDRHLDDLQISIYGDASKHPSIDRGEAQSDELRQAHSHIRKQNREIEDLIGRGAKPGRDTMKKIIDQHRHASSGRVNYVAVARALECSDKTAKRWIADLGLSGYADGR